MVKIPCRVVVCPGDGGRGVTNSLTAQFQCSLSTAALDMYLYGEYLAREVVGPGDGGRRVTGCLTAQFHFSVSSAALYMYLCGEYLARDVVCPGDGGGRVTSCLTAQCELLATAHAHWVVPRGDGRRNWNSKYIARIFSWGTRDNFGVGYYRWTNYCNYTDTKPKCRHLKNWPGKELAAGVYCLSEFIDWWYSPLCWYFRPSFVNCCPPTFSVIKLCVNKYATYTYVRGGGYGVLDLRQINTLSKVPLHVNFLDDDILHCLLWVLASCQNYLNDPLSYQLIGGGCIGGLKVNLLICDR
jgi:hypothetical protein